MIDFVALFFKKVTLGDYGLSHDQERVQIGMWSMFASPLLMSVDLRTMNPQSKALLQNKRVLAINQDPLGIQGKRILKVIFLFCVKIRTFDILFVLAKLSQIFHMDSYL